MQKAMKKGAQPSSHIKGIDGLKGLAIIAIILYHLRMPGLSGGFVGVELFFVISGYLTTRSILVRRGKGVPHSTRTFYVRRLRRLYPTLVLVTLSTLCLAAVLCRQALVGAFPHAIGALTFSYNWVDIAQGSSYFSATVPEPLKNMWYVAVLAQFLLICPWLVALLARIGGVDGKRSDAADTGADSRRKGSPQTAGVEGAAGTSGQTVSWVARVRRAIPVIVLILLAAASAAGMITLYAPGSDPTRVYYGTDTHCFALLLGMAFAWHAHGRQRTPADARTRYTQQLVGWTGLAVLALCVAGCSSGLVAFRGGLLVGAIASVALFQGILMPGTRLESFASCVPLVWLGRHSYGLYLWHYPLYTIAATAFASYLKSAWWHEALVCVAVIALSMALTWIGDHAFATPIASRGFRRFFIADQAWSGPVTCLKTGSAIAVVLVLTYGSGFALACAPRLGETEAVLRADGQLAQHSQLLAQDSQPQSSSQSSPMSNAFNQQIAADAQIQQKKTDERDAAAQAALEKQVKEAQQAKQLAEERARKAQEAVSDPAVLQQMPSGDQMSMIGDSVMLGASPSILSKFPGAYIDAQVSRHVGDGLTIISSLASAGTLRPWLVVGLGTNGMVTAQDIAAIDSAMGQGHNLVLVTGYADRSWIAPSNQAVADYAAAHSDHVLVADWDTAIGGHTDLLLSDGFHPTEPAGGDLYAQTLYDSIALWLKNKG